MKKALLIIGIVFVVLLGALLILPIAFKDQIKAVVVEQANENLNAKVGFEDFSLSFIRNFPHASVGLYGAYIAGVNEFEKDTLLQVGSLNIVVDIKSFFSEEGYLVNKILLSDALIYAHVLKDGKANWDIVKATDEPEIEEVADTTSTEFKLSLQNLTIKNANVVYNDEQANMYAAVLGLNHKLSGDMTADSTLLKTDTKINSLTLKMGDVPYLNKAVLLLAADIKANMADDVYAINKAEFQLNAIKLIPEGWVKLIDSTTYELDVKLDAPEIQFKDVLSLIPAIYTKDFADIQTKGKVALNMFAKGIYSDPTYPAFGLNLKVADAWFKYPALPKSIDDINISVAVSNPGGDLDNTKVNVDKFALALGGNPFSGNLMVTTPMSDPDLTAYAKGKVNLGMVKDVYPMDSIGDLSGILNLDLNLKGKMSYVEKEQYEKFLFAGNLNLADLVLDTESLPQKLEINKMNLIFNSKYVELPALDIKIGKSDLSAKGRLENFIPYLFKDETLKGNLQTSSQYLNLADLMSESEEAPATNEEISTEPMSVIVLPQNLNFSLSTTFKQIIFDQMNITNANGNLQLADSKLDLKNISLSAMGGDVVLSGVYNTVDALKPKVDMSLKITDVLFKEVFKQVETVQKLTPIFENITGRFSSNMTISTPLAGDMMPILNELDAKGLISSNNMGIKDVKVMNTIASVLKKDEFKDPVLKDVSIPFEITKGRVYTDPFSFNIANTKLDMDRGSTGLDQTIDYTLRADIPTSDNSVIKLNKLGLKIGGTFSNPKVSIETKALIDEAKAVLKEEATKKVEEAKEVAKEQINQAATQAKEDLKENLNEELKKTGDNLKEGLKGLFKK